MNGIRQAQRAVQVVQIAGDTRKEVSLVVSIQLKSGNRASETRRHSVVVASDVSEAIVRVRP